MGFDRHRPGAAVPGRAPAPTAAEGRGALRPSGHPGGERAGMVPAMKRTTQRRLGGIPPSTEEDSANLRAPSLPATYCRTMKLRRVPRPGPRLDALIVRKGA